MMALPRFFGPPASTPIRQVVQLTVLTFIGFLFTRVFAFEPFGVPTGSMAGTFLGNNRAAICPRCQALVRLGEPGAGIQQQPNYADACCQNCGKREIDLLRARELPGDRVMVDKQVYLLRSPRRWEVAVFRCPVDLTKPYVKRVLGLPGESVQIMRGDFYANGQLQRKTLPVLRELAVPVFDMNYAPPGGWNPRWLLEPLSEDPRLPRPKAASTPQPAGYDVLSPGQLVLDAESGPAQGLTYRHWNLDEQSEDAVRDFVMYNGPPRWQKPNPVSDFYVSFDLEVLGGTAGTLAVRLYDGADTVKVELPLGAP
ncbi:MAG: S26 family signal peptidase, partial [Gemmataceae bacterium]